MNSYDANIICCYGNIKSVLGMNLFPLELEKYQHSDSILVMTNVENNILLHLSKDFGCVEA